MDRSACYIVESGNGFDMALQLGITLTLHAHAAVSLCFLRTIAVCLCYHHGGVCVTMSKYRTRMVTLLLTIRGSARDGHVKRWRRRLLVSRKEFLG